MDDDPRRTPRNTKKETWRHFVFFVDRLFGWRNRHFNLWNLRNLRTPFYAGKKPTPPIRTRIGSQDWLRSISFAK